MEIDFLKMQGCGDDVVVLDGSRVPPEAPALLPAIAQGILDRTFGVGGNALIVFGTSAAGVLPVRCLDADGDDFAITSNAARCVARYAADSGAVSTNDFLIECGAGRIRAQIIDSANVRVDMGMPLSGEKTAEIRESLRESFTRALLVQGRSVTYTPISLGRSYAMIFVPDFAFPVRKTAREIAAQPDFPDGTGIGFVQVCAREELRLRTWEAPGEPPADECGCAAAALVASVVNGFTDRELFVRLRGGTIFLQWEESDNHIWLTGPAAYVFTGTYDHLEQPEGDA
jgi:diaminopimelate epimerase